MLEIYQELARLLSKGEPAVLATVISSEGSAPREAGAKMLIRKDGTSIGTVGGGGVEYQVLKRAAQIVSSGEAETIHLDLSGREGQAVMICGGSMGVFIEPILPAETLYLFGAGHISQSVAKVGKMLGLRIAVIDPRSEFNNAEHFPDADLLVVEGYAPAFSSLNIEKDSYIVICTPGHISDEDCLEHALETQAKYIGMIGSKRKVKEVKGHLVKKGVPVEKLDSVHSPIGLDIGAETPQEIAISILAEIVRFKRA